MISMPYRGKNGQWKVRINNDSGHFAAAANDVFWSEANKTGVVDYFATRGIAAKFQHFRDLNTAKLQQIAERTAKR
jgi:hypothetical protein